MSNYGSQTTPGPSVPINRKISPSPAPTHIESVSFALAITAFVVPATIFVVLAAAIYIRRVLRRFNAIAVSRLRSNSVAAMPTLACRPPAGDHNEAAVCCVCLGPLKVGEMVRALPGCFHVFHVVCIDEWLRSQATCPMCRSDVRLHIPANLAGRGERTAEPRPPLPLPPI